MTGVPTESGMSARLVVGDLVLLSLVAGDSHLFVRVVAGSEEQGGSLTAMSGRRGRHGRVRI